jgi:hypothetical protein
MVDSITSAKGVRKCEETLSRLLQRAGRLLLNSLKIISLTFPDAFGDDAGRLHLGATRPPDALG